MDERLGNIISAADSPSIQPDPALIGKTQVSLPMLFLQGSRDRLADFDLLKPVVESLGAQARLQVMDAADHSFELPIRRRRSRPETVGLLADWTRDWCQSLGDGPG